ncbi:MAG TPA: DNA polymerase III subunit delta [Candidatus Cloacimonadota bacterium]|nr:DNA polymerase III subunit delta [Candidatus Cloacimonadota bacterium]
MKQIPQEVTAQEFISEYHAKTSHVTIYTLLGADMFYMGKVLQILISKYVEPASKDFDFIQYYGDEIRNDSFMEQLDMLPFMASKRVVIIRDIDKIDAQHLQRLPAYLKNPSSEVILIMTAEKIDARTVVGKEINQHSLKVICKEPRYLKDIKNWLETELTRRKIKMDSKAREFFSDTVQMDYCAAMNELEKIILYTDGSKDVITFSDVRNALGIARSNTIYELQDSIGLKNCVESLSMLERMLQNDMEPIYIIYMLNGFFQQLWKILSLFRKNMSQNEIKQRYLNEIHPNFRDKMIRFAQNYSHKQIRRIFDFLMEADTDLKSSGIKKNLIMDLLVYRICNSRDRG